MWSHLCLHLLSLVSLVFAQAIPIVNDTSAQVVPNQYIVEYASSSSLSKRDVHESFTNELSARGSSVNVTVTSQYSISSVFSGAAVQVQSQADLVSLASLGSVVAIYPVFWRQAPSIPWQYTPSGPNDPALPPDYMPAHVMSSVNLVQAQGYSGSGVKVAVIDSGVDYTLPVLGGGFGQGHKVWTGYDFVGNNYPTTPPQPDSDPLDECFGHGTAVASTIAGNYDATYNFTGVAPNAQIAAYRVFGCAGLTNDAIVLQALQMAWEDGNDIINLSLSDNSGWSESVLAVTASRIANSGKIVVTAAGNNGALGPFFTGSPGTGYNVIDVGNVDPTTLQLWYAQPSTNYPRIPYLPTTLQALNVSSGSHPIWVPSDVSGCSTFTGVPANFANYVTIVQRGACAFQTKINNAISAGGTVILFANTGPGLVQPSATGLPSAMISQTDGQYLISAFQKKQAVSLTFSSGAAAIVPNGNTEVPNMVAVDSSWGPTNELYLKPNVAAGGFEVLVAWPSALGSWKLVSGTSFSAPLVSGVAALLLQAKGKGAIASTIVSLAAKSILQQTASPVYAAPNSTGGIAPLIMQGAGVVNAYNAINQKTFISPSFLELNDTNHAQYTQTISLWNLGNSLFGSSTYTITHIPALTVLTWNNGAINPTPITVNAPATVKFSSTKVTPFSILPGSVTVTFTPPSGLDPSTFPVYSGQIVFTSPTEEVVATYMGLAANMRDSPVIDNTATFFGLKLPFTLDALGNVQTSSRTYDYSGTNFPLLYYRLLTGTPNLRVDLVNANIQFNATDPMKRSIIAFPDEVDGSALVKRDLGRIRSHRRASMHDSHFGAIRHARQPSADNLTSGNLDSRSLSEPEVPEKRSIVSSLLNWLFPNRPGTPGSGSGSGTTSGNSFASVPIVGVLSSAQYCSRSTNDINNGGINVVNLEGRTFANGTTIPNGSYKILLRALKVTGDPTNEADYESWLSYPININVTASS